MAHVPNVISQSTLGRISRSQAALMVEAVSTSEMWISTLLHDNHFQPSLDISLTWIPIISKKVGNLQSNSAHWSEVHC
jgi:hypothetical protein